jgi:hypothetical protein
MLDVQGWTNQFIKELVGINYLKNKGMCRISIRVRG